MTTYRLHYFPESGNSYKLALMLTLCGQTFEPVWTDFGGGVTRTPEWRARVNTLGELPVLEEGDERLTQTAPILLRLAQRYDYMGATSADQEFEILRWLFWDNHKLTSYMATYRFLRSFTPSPEPKVLDFFRGRIDGCLAILEAHLQGQLFVCGDVPTVADISMTGYLCFPSDESGYEFKDDHPVVSAWLKRIREIPGWLGPYDLLPGKRLPRFT